MTATFKTYEPETRQPKKNDEDALQAACFDYWNKYFRKTSLLFSVPNGQKRNYHEASIAVATGLTDGVSDLILLLPEAKADFLELKTPKGVHKKGQKIFEANVRRLGFKYFLIRTFEQFQQHLIARLGPPNEEANDEEEARNADQETRIDEEEARRNPEAQRPVARRNEAVSSGIGRRRNLS